MWLVLVGLLGSVTSSDSGHSTQLDSHSNSSVEVAAGPNQGGCSPPSQHRRHSIIQGKDARPAISSKSVGCVCVRVCIGCIVSSGLCSYSDMMNSGFTVVSLKSFGVALLIIKLVFFSLVLKCICNTLIYSCGVGM